MTDKMREMLIRLSKLAAESSGEAQEENRRLGIPNVFSINGIMVYEYDNKISMTPPPEWEKFDPSKAQKKSKSRCLTHRLFHFFKIYSGLSTTQTRSSSISNSRRLSQ